MTSMRCPVRRHDHDLTVHTVHVQDGTGDAARTWACPSGRYRWFVLDGHGPHPLLRQIRPRWGWSA